MLVNYTLAWIPMVGIAIVNGAARELGYGKAMSELAAHQLSTATAILLFVAYTWLLSLLWPLESVRQSLTIGAIWFTLTVAFEFLFGHYVAKHSWSRLLHDYNLLQGRVWILVLLATTLAPYLIYRLRS